jgi:hypothetical protein
MPSNIKLSLLGIGAGKPVDGTVTISGSDMANTYLTGNIDQNVYRHLPDTVGSISGSSYRPLGDQYQFYEFDGKIPTITINSLTSPDNTSQYSGYRLGMVYSVDGILPTETYNVKLSINDVYTGTQYFHTASVVSQSRTYDDEANTYLIPGQYNSVKLELDVVENTKYNFDTASVLVWPLNLTIINVEQTSSFSYSGAAGNYRYDSGSVTFRAIVGGGQPPYLYNWTGSGFVSSSTLTFNNATTTTDVPITLTVRDSYVIPDSASANNQPTMRRPITVSYSSSVTPEPYVQYTLTGTVNYNVESLTLTYLWTPGSGMNIVSPSTTASPSPNVFYSSTGSLISSSIKVSSAFNNTINYFTSSFATPAMVAPTFTSTTFTPSTELFAVVLNTSSLGTAIAGTTLKYDIEYRVKDSGGSYGSWIAITSNSTSTSGNVSIVGKTTTAQVAQSRVRARRSNGTTEFNSTYFESGEVTIPIKGIVTITNRTDLLTGANRTFDGTVTLGGANDNGFTVTGVTAVSTGSTVTASGAKTASGVITITVNNPLTNVNDGTASHVATVVDGNGYTITSSFTTQYKINSNVIGLTATWTNARQYTSAEITFSRSTLASGFSPTSFQRKVNIGGTYANENSGVYTTALTYSAPNVDQTWYYQLKISGGAYTTSDFYETNVTMYGYPGQDYNYTPSANPSSGTLSQVGAVTFTVSRTGGNFAKISATLLAYYPSSTLSDTKTLSEASITDGNSTFSFATVNLYESSNCGSSIGTAYGAITLKYEIDVTRYYTHPLSNTNVTVNREPGSISVSDNSGFVSGYGIRGNSFILNASYVTYGPPYSAMFNTYQMIYLDDTSMASYVDNQGNYYNDVQYLRTQNTSPGYCRYTASRTKTISGRNRGDTYSVTWYGNEYTVVNTDYDYAIQASGAQTVGKIVYIRGRRIDSATAPTVVQSVKGSTEISFSSDGTPSGPDSTINIYDDGITRTYEYSANGSTGWTNCPSVVTLPGGLLNTTVYFRVKYVHDDWGNTVYSTSTSVFLSDWDYSLTLSNTSQKEAIWYTDASSIYVDGTAFELTDTDPGGSGTTLTPNISYQSYFYQINDLSDSSDASFPGAYMFENNSLGSSAISRIYLDNADYKWKGQPASTISSVKNSSSSTPSTAALGLLSFHFTSPDYGNNGLITITAQKSSGDTTGQKKYYFRYNTPAAVNQISYTSISEACSSFTVTYTTGTVQTANKVQIQTSSDNSTWTTHTEYTTGVASSTAYTATVTGVGSGATVYHRARLLNGGTVLTTTASNSYTHPGTPSNSALTVSLHGSGCQVDLSFNAGTSYWTIYTTNSAGSLGSYSFYESGVGDTNDIQFDGPTYFVVVWYRNVSGCVSSESTSAVYELTSGMCEII